MLSLLLSITSARSEGDIEIQSKFKITNESSITELLKTTSVGQYQIKNHSVYVYYDLYLDTPDLALFNNKLSLRLRKRTFESGEMDYDLQLKSEPNVEDDARMEVEEGSLSFYKVKIGDQWEPIEDLLGSIFKFVEGDIPQRGPASDFHSQIELITDWIKFKSNSTIDPFVKLKRFFPQDPLIVSKLRPVLIGVSKRERFHVFIQEGETELKPLYTVRELPTFFIQNPRNIWLAEMSADHAHFFSIKNKKARNVIMELEIENKYPDSIISKEYIHKLNNELAKKFSIEANYDSKYRDSILHLMDNI